MYITKCSVVCIFGMTQIQQFSCISRNMRAAVLCFVILLLYFVISGFYSQAMGQVYVQMAHGQGHTLIDMGTEPQ